MQATKSEQQTIGGRHTAYGMDFKLKKSTKNAGFARHHTHIHIKQRQQNQIIIKNIVMSS